MRIQLEDFEERYESHPAVGHGAFRTSCHLFLPFLDGLIRHPAILGPVASILGEDLLVWGTSFFTKESRSDDMWPGIRIFITGGLTPEMK